MGRRAARASRRRDAETTKARRRKRATDSQGQGGVRLLVCREPAHILGRRLGNTSAPARCARPLVVEPRDVTKMSFGLLAARRAIAFPPPVAIIMCVQNSQSSFGARF